MQDIKNNKFFWIVVAVTIFNIMMYFGSKVLIDKTADRVIKKLQKEYSPSPYGPGIDPDKVDPDAINQHRIYFNALKEEKVDKPEIVLGQPEESLNWRQEWERDRGFNLEQ